MKPAAVVADIDSTLADTLHRQGLILQGEERENTDWTAYAKACADDLPTATVPLLSLLKPHYKIILLTSRPEESRPETEAWMARHDVRFDRLVMDGNSGLGTVGYKLTGLRALMVEYDIKLLLEDSWNIRTAVEQELGIPTLVVRAYAPEALELRY